MLLKQNKRQCGKKLYREQTQTRSDYIYQPRLSVNDPKQH